MTGLFRWMKTWRQKTGPFRAKSRTGRPIRSSFTDTSELGDILKKTIQGLSPGFRTVFVLRDVEGLSTEETAEMLDLSVPAVKSRLLRARLQLRERLARYFKSKKGGDGQQ